MANRQKREQAAAALAQIKADFAAQRDKIENEQAYIDARNQMQTDYGVDIAGEMIAGLDRAVEMIRWIESFENLDIGSNRNT